MTDELAANFSNFGLGATGGKFNLKSADEPNSLVSWQIKDGGDEIILDHEAPGSGQLVKASGDDPIRSLQSRGEFVSTMTFQTGNRDAIWNSAMEHKEDLLEPLTNFFYDQAQGKVVGIKKELFETYIKFRRSEDQENLEKSLEGKLKQNTLGKILALPPGESVLIKVNKVIPQGSPDRHPATLTIRETRTETIQITKQIIKREISFTTDHPGEIIHEGNDASNRNDGPTITEIDDEQSSAEPDRNLKLKLGSSVAKDGVDVDDVSGRDSPDATPFNTNMPASSSPLAGIQPQPSTGASPDLIGQRQLGPGASPCTTGKQQHDEGASPGMKDDGEEQEEPGAIYLRDESKKDLLLYEMAEKLNALSHCKIRELAFKLDLSETNVRQILHDNPEGRKMQLYQMLRLFWEMTRSAEVLDKLQHALKLLKFVSVLEWFREQLDPGCKRASAKARKEKEASLKGDDECGNSSMSMSSSESSLQSLQRNDSFSSSTDYYDIFLMHSGLNEHTLKLEKICETQSWKIFVHEASEKLGVPAVKAAGTILETSSHMVILITEEDCRRYKAKKDDMHSYVVEMAFELAFSEEESMDGKIIPIRSCAKKLLPLSLRALTGTCINDENIESQLKRSIDTSIRAQREQDNST